MKILGFLFIFITLHDFSTARNLPNFLVLLADDLGYGDITCYGNTKVKTPNIDKLAQEGVKFTRMYAQPMCTPSRAALMTGRLPPRTGMMMGHHNIPVFATIASNGGLRPQDLTIARLLQKRGYKNAAIGKWHIGHGKDGVYLPNGVGFESFYGTPSTHIEACSSYMPFDPNSAFRNVIYNWKNAILTYLSVIIAIRFMKFMNKKFFLALFILLFIPIGILRILLAYSIAAQESCILYRDANILEQPYKDENMTLRTTREALRVLQAAKNENRPFFLYMNFLTPHVPAIVSRQFNGTTGFGPYYDSIAELDWSVGKIMNKIKELGFDDDTFVYFTSDNGPQGVSGRTLEPVDHDQLGTAGFAQDSFGKQHKLRGMKGETYEGGIRVPGIIRWKSKFPANVQTSGLSGLHDLLPTIADLTGQTESLKSYYLDGKSLVPLLQKPGTNSHHDFLFHWCGMSELSAVSHGNYKMHFFSGDPKPICRGNVLDPPELYDMSRDPGETTPLKLDDHQDVVKKIYDAVERHQISMEHPKHGKMKGSQFEYPPIPWQFPCAGKNCQRDNDENDDFMTLGIKS